MASLSLADWSWDPTVLLGLVAVLALYRLAWRHGALRRDDDVSAWTSHPYRRVWWFGAGIAVAFIALQSPIDRGGDDYLFALHMVQHLLLMMVAPPLCILGLAGLNLPGGALGRIRCLLGWLSRPWVATVVFSAVLLLWHIPDLYDATLTTAPIHVLEHLSFIGVGILFWWPIVDPQRVHRPPVSPFTKIAMLVASGIPPTVLGLIFAIARHPFYEFYARAPRLWGLSAVTDQQIAGVLMFGAGNLIYFAAIFMVFWRLFRDPTLDEEAHGALG